MDYFTQGDKVYVIKNKKYRLNDLTFDTNQIGTFLSFEEKEDEDWLGMFRTYQKIEIELSDGSILRINKQESERDEYIIIPLYKLKDYFLEKAKQIDELYDTTKA